MGNNETKGSGPVFLLGDFTKASESMISEIRNKFERSRALGVLVPFAVALWRPNHAITVTHTRTHAQTSTQTYTPTHTDTLSGSPHSTVGGSRPCDGLSQ